MNVQERKAAGRGSRRSVAALANGAVVEAPRDAQVTRMATAESEARAAQRQALVATAAYFRAEKRGFEPGHELDDWLAAEAEVGPADLPSVVTSVQLIGTRSAS